MIWGGDFRGVKIGMSEGKIDKTNKRRLHTAKTARNSAELLDYWMVLLKGAARQAS